jgi:hypothetical protein
LTTLLLSVVLGIEVFHVNIRETRLHQCDSAHLHNLREVLL